MERADALRALIERLEAGSHRSPKLIKLGVGPEAVRPFYGAAVGSIDAVARLEAPLRERGWRGPAIDPPGRYEDIKTWSAGWVTPLGAPAGRVVREEAPTEARARLLAVLRARLWEAEQPALSGASGA